MQSNSYQGLQNNKSQINFVDDAIVVEAALQININNKPYTVVMRTPNDDENLITGLLYAEDIYKHSQPLNFEIVAIENEIPTIINVSIKKDFLGDGYLTKRTLLSVSSCGICGKTSLESIEIKGKKLTDQPILSSENITFLLDKMAANQTLFQQTGGCHASAIFDENLNLLTLKEDIGRHNALDKAIGNLLINNALSKAKILTVSGRVSYEIVSKAFIAKIPIIIAVSACSSLAIDFAKEFGICLIGFSRTDKFTIYANKQLIKIPQNA